ncbi:unnamed protein product [Staurois parvus]|uniref:Uncharacterized protein n=1 Tax=Staurois parvus TaxID=386267 RepID=A0ABN9GW22_9NEOB|nr:unnamed protein product [Staurois parvus]
MMESKLFPTKRRKKWVWRHLCSPHCYQMLLKRRRIAGGDESYVKRMWLSLPVRRMKTWLLSALIARWLLTNRSRKMSAALCSLERARKKERSRILWNWRGCWRERKAELRALEEGDVSLSGSSPRSDFSQSDEVQKAKPVSSKWKVFVPSASPESTSHSSSKTGRETPETEMGAEAAECPATPIEPESDPAPVKATPKQEDGEDDDLKFQIGELANSLISKLEFLGINRQAVSNFHVLLFQTETRISDWREGALSGIYLKRKLQDASEQIKQYEINATPKGWSCHWDRYESSPIFTFHISKHDL